MPGQQMACSALAALRRRRTDDRPCNRRPVPGQFGLHHRFNAPLRLDPAQGTERSSARFQHMDLAFLQAHQALDHARKVSQPLRHLHHVRAAHHDPRTQALQQGLTRCGHPFLEIRSVDGRAELVVSRT